MLEDHEEILYIIFLIIFLESKYKIKEKKIIKKNNQIFFLINQNI